MPRFALLDADSRVVNIVALARIEDFTHVASSAVGREQDEALEKECRDKKLSDDEHQQAMFDAEHRSDPDYGKPAKPEPTDAHHVQHGSVEIVEATLATRIGQIHVDGKFVDPEPSQAEV